jgi:hypothetical protein
MAWVVADLIENRLEALVTLSEEAVSAGTNPKTLTWNAAGVPASLAQLVALPAEVLGVRMELTPTSATARRPKLQLQDSASDIVMEATSGFATSATTLINFDFSPGFSPATSTIELIASTTNARTPMPIGVFLSPGQKLVSTQDTVVDANDALVVHVRLRIRKV